MIRLTPAQATRLHQFMVDLQGNFKNHPNNKQIFDDAWDDTREALQQQLESPDHAEDLLDTVYSYLVANGTRPIGGDYLKRLQQAILLPNELRTLKNQPPQRTCKSCGCNLNEFEAVTYLENDIYCMKCYFPRTLAVESHCSVHSEAPRTQEFPAKLTKLIQKQVGDAHRDCPVCQANLAAGKSASGQRDDTFTRLTGDQVRVQMNPRPQPTPQQPEAAPRRNQVVFNQSPPPQPASPSTSRPPAILQVSWGDPPQGLTDAQLNPSSSGQGEPLSGEPLSEQSLVERMRSEVMQRSEWEAFQSRQRDELANSNDLRFRQMVIQEAVPSISFTRSPMFGSAATVAVTANPNGQQWFVNGGDNNLDPSLGPLTAPDTVSRSYDDETPLFAEDE